MNQFPRKSQLMSKVKAKLKEEQKEKKAAEELAPGLDDPAMAPAPLREAPSATSGSGESGMIGSIEEYASLVGKSVSRLAETKYEAPEVEASEEEDEDSDNDGDDLWGAIMGGP